MKEGNVPSHNSCRILIDPLQMNLRRSSMNPFRNRTKDPSVVLKSGPLLRAAQDLKS